tara:strand:+ start:963 stop:1334 length:372 start_codon:yes stop_codon:yes gene_type:complete
MFTENQIEMSFDVFLDGNAPTSPFVIADINLPVEPEPLLSEVDDSESDYESELVHNLRLEMLKRLKATVDPRCSEKLRDEMIEWMMSDDIQPFSFATCSAEAGADHEILRDSILYNLKKQGAI